MILGSESDLNGQNRLVPILGIDPLNRIFRIIPEHIDPFWSNSGAC
ncbi:hypothetical protein ADIS_0809 [Lunatimonas lonarensis]|uniref:Uncharacterized protein n=1 Tax=Lunatimonas lonarensis TaxID=1232681 RepID=R7ZWW0_9BACT|nr:hypothetical protein ADIS_0809 [Lunatimonas lonarensis]